MENKTVEWFRGIPRTLSITSNEWEYGGITADKSAIMHTAILTFVHPETICEFTEVYDINNTKIYTNDIVRLDDKLYVVVKMMNETMGFYLKPLDATAEYKPLHGAYNVELARYIANVEITSNKFAL